MPDPGDGPGGPVPPLCLDENETRRAETTFFFGRGPPYLKVWIGHYSVVYFKNTKYCAFLVYSIWNWILTAIYWCLDKSVGETENGLDFGFVKHRLNSV